MAITSRSRPMTTINWNSIQLTGDPILVVGLRSGANIQGHRLIVDRNVHPALRLVADETLQHIRAMSAIPYTPYVDPGEDEYLSLDPATLTVDVSADDGGPASQKKQTAQLLQTIQNADTLPTLG